jgi:imidazolonepropionase-like amidohydrolase
MEDYEIGRGKWMQLAIRLAATLLAVSTILPVAQAATVLRDFTLIDGTGRDPVAGSALIFDAGRISWVGPAAQLRIPAGATVVDLKGKFVTPGLIDNHVHLGLVHDVAQDIKYYTRESVEQQLRTYAAYGVTTVQVLGTDKDGIFELRAAQRKAQPAMARVYTAGQGLVFKGSYGGVAGLNQPVANEAEARRAVDEQVAKGVDFIKLWVDDEFGDLPSRMPPEISKAIIEQAHKHRLKAIAHIFYLDNAKTLVAQGVDGFAHSVRDQPVDQALLDGMKQRGTTQMAATLSREASFTYTKLPFLDDPFFNRSITPAAYATLTSAERQKKLAAAKHFGQYQGVLDTALNNMRREIAAGITYGVGSDSGPTGRFAGYFLHWELQLMVRAGLTPLQALTAATGTNAKLIGAKDSGTIATGKAADLVVFDADPSADIRNTRTIRAVYIAGQSVPTIWSVCAGRAANECGGPNGE